MRKKNVALIIGVTGQDGSYLSHLLLSKGYVVHGVRRRSSTFNTERIDDLINNGKNFYLHYGDLSDSGSLFSIIKNVRPTEIYNLGAQSHVAVSFIQPTYTGDIDALGVSRIYEILLALDLDETKVYQASTSEMFGSTPPPQNEDSTFKPQSPYGAAKVMAYWLTVQYREANKRFASNGILFNHESPVRGETFVSRKVIKSLVNYKYNKGPVLEIGNLYAQRDWGHARDYAEAQWLILQHHEPTDFVIATGKTYTVKEFVEKTAKVLDIQLSWEGDDENERAYDQHGALAIRVNKKYYRPLEVENLQGDASKAKKFLNWTPKTNFEQLIKEMADNEISILNHGVSRIKWLNEQ
jgi:GDPmannose 4,6-dehydratase